MRRMVSMGSNRLQWYMHAGMDGICEIGRTDGGIVDVVCIRNRWRCPQKNAQLDSLPDMTWTSTLVSEGNTSPGQSTISTSDVQ